MTAQMTTPATETETTGAQTSPLPAHVRDRYRDPNGVLQNDPQRGIVRVRAEDLEFACSLITDRLVTYRDAVYGEGDPEHQLIECAAEGWDELHRHARQLAALAGALGTQQGRSARSRGASTPTRAGSPSPARSTPPSRARRGQRHHGGRRPHARPLQTQGG